MVKYETILENAFGKSQLSTNDLCIHRLMKNNIFMASVLKFYDSTDTRKMTQSESVLYGILVGQNIVSSKNLYKCIFTVLHYLHTPSYTSYELSIKVLSLFLAKNFSSFYWICEDFEPEEWQNVILDKTEQDDYDDTEWRKVVCAILGNEDIISHQSIVESAVYDLNRTVAEIIHRNQ